MSSITLTTLFLALFSQMAFAAEGADAPVLTFYQSKSTLHAYVHLALKSAGLGCSDTSGRSLLQEHAEHCMVIPGLRAPSQSVMVHPREGEIGCLQMYHEPGTCQGQAFGYTIDRSEWSVHLQHHWFLRRSKRIGADMLQPMVVGATPWT